jgi:thiaminase/transcriptional activator TenA
VGLFLRAIARTADVCREIVNHPFNQELIKGSLSHQRFGYYVEQDCLYLKELYSCYDILAAKAPEKHSRSFSRYANRTLASEQEMLRKFFKEEISFEKTGFIAPATLNYTEHLLRTCKDESLEVGVASALPCFTIYQQIGIFACYNSSANNPYAKWIETYSSQDFTISVERSVEIFNDLASNTNEATRQKMLDTYNRSCLLEWHFFNDVYHQRRLDNSKISAPGQIVQKPDVTKLASSLSRL